MCDEWDADPVANVLTSRSAVPVRFILSVVDQHALSRGADPLDKGVRGGLESIAPWQIRIRQKIFVSLEGTDYESRVSVSQHHIGAVVGDQLVQVIE